MSTDVYGWLEDRGYHIIVVEGEVIAFNIYTRDIYPEDVDYSLDELIEFFERMQSWDDEVLSS